MRAQPSRWMLAWPVRLLVFWGLGVVGCAEPPPPLAATFQGQTLESERLAEWMVLGQPLPIDEGTAVRLAEHWVEMAAVSQALRDGRDLTDSNTLLAATEWERREHIRTTYLTQMAPTPTLRAEAVDSAYDAGTLRLVAHVLRAVSPAATQTEQARQRSMAEQILAALRNGGSWENASAGSEDPTTQHVNGIMGLFAPGELEATLDAQLFALPEGAISGVVPSPAGFHILYRPRLEDIRPFYADLLRQRLESERQQSVTASFAQHLSGEPDEVAADRLTVIAGDPYRLPQADALILEYTMGRENPASAGLSANDLALAVSQMSGDDRRDLVRASTEERQAFLMQAALQDITWHRAQEAGIGLPESSRVRIEEEFVQQVSQLSEALGDGGVDRYFEAFLARRISQAIVPAGLARLLLAETKWALSDDGVSHAVQRGQAFIEALGDRR